MFCATCGRKNERNGNFCAGCGAKMDVHNYMNHGVDSDMNNTVYDRTNNHDNFIDNFTDTKVGYNQIAGNYNPQVQNPSFQRNHEYIPRRATKYRRFNRKTMVIASTIAVVVIIILVVNFVRNSNSLVGTWENVRGPNSGVVYEFGRNTFSWTNYSRDGREGFTEGAYSISRNEITFISSGDAWTQVFQIVGENLIIGEIAYTRVSSRQNLSFEVVEGSGHSGIDTDPIVILP